MCQSRGGGGGGGVQHRSSEGRGSGAGIDKKEVAVWKLPDNISKVQFRHWINAMDLQLEAIHGWKCPEFILNRIKRSPTEITQELFQDVIMKQVSNDISSDNNIDLLAPRS